MFSSDNFFKHTTQFKALDGSLITGMCYSYESGKMLYDVIILNIPVNAGGYLAQHFIRENMGPLNPTIIGMKSAHYAIERHFGI